MAATAYGTYIGNPASSATKCHEVLHEQEQNRGANVTAISFSHFFLIYDTVYSDLNSML